MNKIATGVEGLRILFVNVFGISHSDDSWTLVDAGIPLSQGRIQSWAEKVFGKPPNAVVLSHGHFDHVSSAWGLAEHWDVPIYAHKLESPYLTGETEYAPPNIGAGGGSMSLLAPLFPRGPVDLGARLHQLPSNGEELSEMPEMPGWRILHTPGHTPGHVSFFRESDRVMLPADAFCTTKPESFFEVTIAQESELHGPPSYFTSDWSLAGQSVTKLAALDPAVIAPGHGKPIAGTNVAFALKELAQRFDRVAVPDNRRNSAA